MPESTRCVVCGTEVDTRGLSGHMETHEPQELAPVIAQTSEVDRTGDNSRVFAKTRTQDDSVTVRAMKEVVVEDEDLKRKIVAELRQMVSDGGFKPHSSERRVD